MEKRKLGRTGMEVSVISFGALPIQRCTMDEAGPILHKVLDAGINFIDTARAYTDSEAKIGRHISDRRSEYYLATKSMARDKEGMAKDIDISLCTMQVEYIDLYQVHNIKTRQDLDAVMAPGGALEALKDAKAAGKIRFIGVTGHNIELLIEAVKSNEFDTVQVPFNCIETTADAELFPLAKSMDVGRIVMKPLGGGQIRSVDLALRFILENDISVAIPGMDAIAQIEQNLGVAKNFRPLTDEEREILKNEAELIGPNFCRRCGYCMPCAAGIDIPQTFIFDLQYNYYGLKEAIPMRYAAMKAKASDCIECGVCEKRCPYDLPIRERMKRIAQELG
ncbi:MAG: aldo/keto reductase [Veillonellaceae bacterium]|jgi:predicted aldo/keto reductase-like oxidoreductase|nr:aldo/keto reductase [Veillonellaceae bacterium]